jgi:hypothetical protein
MGKSPKADSKNQPLDPPPQDPFEAKEAIQKGQVAPIGSYLRYDVRMILNLLADQLDVPNGDESHVEPSKIESAPKNHPTKTDSIGHDWDSNTGDVLSCIEDGKPAPVGWFLRDLADFLSKLGRVAALPAHFIRLYAGDRSAPSVFLNEEGAHARLRDNQPRRHWSFSGCSRLDSA